MRFIKYQIKKIATTIMASAMVAVVAFSTCGCKIEIEDESTEFESETQELKQTHKLRLTYSDERYTAFFQMCAKEFEEQNEDTQVTLNLISGENYLQTISDTSLNANEVSDVYMLDSAGLSTAYLAGLAQKNNKSAETGAYCDTALNACSYEDYLVAYPLSYRTSVLVYNKAYLLDGSAMKNFEDIKEFAGNLFNSDEESVEETQPEENVVDLSKIETVFECNLTELFLNYCFLGATMNIGGSTGADTSQVQVCTDETVAQAGLYTSLIEYFSISTSRDYETIYDRFVSGKSVFTILSTDSLNDLEKLIEDQKTAWEEEKANQTTAEGETAETEAVEAEEPEFFAYGTLPIPDYDDNSKTAPLSITTALVVNPYSKDLELAEKLAYFISFDKADDIYKESGMLSARKSVRYDHLALCDAYASYEKSVQKNKMRYGEQIYPLIEIALHNIVAGEDARTELQAVDDYMANQLE